jgi:hypothetical protein
MRIGDRNGFVVCFFGRAEILAAAHLGFSKKRRGGDASRGFRPLRFSGRNKLPGAESDACHASKENGAIFYREACKLDCKGIKAAWLTLPLRPLVVSGNVKNPNPRLLGATQRRIGFSGMHSDGGVLAICTRERHIQRQNRAQISLGLVRVRYLHLSRFLVLRNAVHI